MSEAEERDSSVAPAPRGNVHERATRPGLSPDEIAAKATQRIPAPQLGGLLALAGRSRSSAPPPLLRPPAGNDPALGASTAGSRVGPSRVVVLLALLATAIIIGGLLFLLTASNHR
jgi:hypothetical protein